ncbi:MAG: hypothetical protein ACD_75C00799G0002 [uncultured bacterium]|nr:MAG: hypothetical protein ACD_75C00799G0002 [uncultured bacterium]
MAHAGRGNGLRFGLDLGHTEFLTPDGIAPVKAAVNAFVGAEIGDVERDVELDGPAEILNRQFMGLLRHTLKTCRGERTEQHQEVVWREYFRVERPVHPLLCDPGKKVLKIKVPVADNRGIERQGNSSSIRENR